MTFNCYCPSFYGMELWTNTKCLGNLKKLAVSHHAATKRRLGLPKAMATICLVNVLTFEHFEQYMGKYKCNSPCFRSCKNYFMNLSNYVHFAGEIFVVNYHVTDLIDQDREEDREESCFLWN